MNDQEFIGKMFELIRVMRQIVENQNQTITEMITIFENEPVSKITKEYLEEMKKHINNTNGTDNISAEFGELYERIDNEKEI